LNSETKKLKTNIIPILSKEDLAMKLNIPRPSLSRELIKLKEQGIIDYNKNYIELKKLAGN
jgi:Mn-dependent DtxR family transcriptional regulator